MRITQISIDGLFGVFNYAIPFNLEDRITIIHGPNGSGKTALLRLLNGLFNSHTSELRAIPFNWFQVDFDNRSSIKVSKENEGDEQSSLKFIPISINGASKPFILPKLSNKNLEEAFPLGMIEQVIPGLERIGPSTWRLIGSNETLYLEDIFDRYSSLLPSIRLKQEKDPQWLRNLKKDVQVRFIQTQRLLSFSDTSRSRRYDPPLPPAPAVENYSKDLAGQIRLKLTEYAELSQSLDRTFPARLVRENSLDRLADTELRNRFEALEEKRSRLTVAGFLDKENKDDFQVSEQMDDQTKGVFSVYVKDVEQKLGVFDDLLNKVDLLKKVVNQRFRYKQMDISKDAGFVFTTSNGQPLPPSGLSSGEQHELVLLYEMLFKMPAEALILIDEPELSLHVAWQKQFLGDLQQITELSSFDVLLSTHSPQIIHDRWDLTVELKGPIQ
ncbi:MAG: AAA family ATPase [Acidobacteria bacterium]|nr:AAA family ATPase [Acidobacteriota bacterium]